MSSTSAIIPYAGDCYLCHYSFEEDVRGPKTRLECSHTFHKNCIEDYIHRISLHNARELRQCPICFRATIGLPVDTKDIIFPVKSAFTRGNFLDN